MGQVDEHARAVYGAERMEDDTGDAFAEWCRTAGRDLAQCIAETIRACGEIGLWLAQPVGQNVPHAMLTDHECMRALYAEYEAAHQFGECLASSGDPAATAVQEGVRTLYQALGVAHAAGAPTP